MMSGNDNSWKNGKCSYVVKVGDTVPVVGDKGLISLPGV